MAATATTFDDLQREFDSLNHIIDGVRAEADAAGMRDNESVADVIRRLARERDELLEVAQLAAESQGWDGSDPDDDRWSDFYGKSRTAVRSVTGAQPA